MSAAFGTTELRKLDNTSPGVIKNPGPGSYVTIPESKRIDNAEMSVFKSGMARKSAITVDPCVPPPTKYNLQDYNSIARKPLQGGAPNNVLSLQKAENKKLIDQMFPFLVKGRM